MLGETPTHDYAMHGTLPAPPTDAARTSEAIAFYEACRAATAETGSLQVIAFGDTPAMQDELAGLTLQVTRRATAALLRELAGGEPMPFVGGHTVLADRRRTPRAIRRTSRARLGRLDAVDEAFAWSEGAGARMRDDWLAGHRRYFGRMAEAKCFAMQDGLPAPSERSATV